MRSYCSGQRPSVTADSVLTVLGLLRFLPSKSSRCLRHRRTLGLPQRRRHRFRSYKTCSRCVPSTGRTAVEPGCVVKNDPREPLFRGRESKLRSGQRFLFKASKIKRLLTRIAKTERVTTKPMVKWLLFASAPRTYSPPVFGSVWTRGLLEWRSKSA